MRYEIRKNKRKRTILSYLQLLSSDLSAQSNSLLHFLSIGMQRWSDSHVNWNSLQSANIYNLIVMRKGVH